MFSFKSLKSSFYVVAAVTFLTPVAMHATPITYDLILTETSPTNTTTYSGTGSVTLNITGAPQNYVGYTTANGLTALDFTIDGQTFDLADAQGGPSTVTFEFSNASAGQVWDITFAETNANNDRLTSTSGYIYYIDNNPVSGTDYTGTFSAQAATASPVPEPSSIALLGTGLFAGMGSLYRRTKAARA